MVDKKGEYAGNGRLAGLISNRHEFSFVQNKMGQHTGLSRRSCAAHKRGDATRSPTNGGGKRGKRKWVSQLRNAYQDGGKRVVAVRRNLKEMALGKRNKIRWDLRRQSILKKRSESASASENVQATEVEGKSPKPKIDIRRGLERGCNASRAYAETSRKRPVGKGGEIMDSQR